MLPFLNSLIDNRTPEQCAVEAAAAAEITIGGVTHQLWRWENGVSIPNAPTAKEEAVLTQHGLGAWKQPDGSWYVMAAGYSGD